MFRIYADNAKLYEIGNDDRYLLINPTLTIELNSAGSLEFTLPECNINYNALTKLKTAISVYQDNKLLWKGRVLSSERDFYNRKQVYCEGWLSCLGDCVKGPYSKIGNKKSDPVGTFFSYILSKYNSHADTDRRINAGNVNFSTSNAISFSNSNYSNHLSELKTQLVDVFGGYLVMRYAANGTAYLDYLSEQALSQGKQQITFGENLLDLTELISAENLYTVMLPLGTKGGKKVTVKTAKSKTKGSISHTKGSEYIYNNAAVAEYGKIYKTVEYSSTASASTLLDMAMSDLAGGAGLKSTIDVSAVDLVHAGYNTEHIECGTKVVIHSEAHGFYMNLVCSKVTYKLDDPSATNYTLGNSYASMTEAQAAAKRRELAGTSDTLFANVDETNGVCRSINHRGYHIQAPENSISAFELSQAYGFAGVETDLALTSDKKWILFHDSSYDNKTTGTGSVSEKTLAYAQSIAYSPSKLGLSSQYNGEPIVTYAEFLSWLNGQRVGSNLFVAYMELKSSVAMNAAQIQTLVQQAGNAGVLSQIVFFASRKPTGETAYERLNALASALAEFPRQPTRIGVMFDGTAGNIADKVKEVKTLSKTLSTANHSAFAYMDYKALQNANATNNVIAELKKQGVPLEVYITSYDDALEPELIQNLNAYIGGVVSDVSNAGAVMFGVDDGADVNEESIARVGVLVASARNESAEIAQIVADNAQAVADNALEKAIKLKDGTSVYYQNTTPDGELHEGDVWLKPSDGGIYRYDGTNWIAHQVGTVSIQDGSITADKCVMSSLVAHEAFVNAINTNSIVIGAANTANSAASTASNAYSTANSASSTASSAYSTANSAASTASNAYSTANSASSTASNAYSTANSASSTANSALSTANSAASAASNAAKTATNFLKLDSSGIIVGDMTSGTLGGNTQIVSTGVNIRNGSTVLASFESDGVTFRNGVKLKSKSDGSAWLVSDKKTTVEGYQLYLVSEGFAQIYSWTTLELKADTSLKLSGDSYIVQNPAYFRSAISAAEVNHSHSGYASSNHSHSGYQQTLVTSTETISIGSIAAGSTSSGSVNAGWSGHTVLGVVGWTTGTSTGNSLFSVPRLYTSGNTLYYLVRNIGSSAYSCTLTVTILYG